jgi:hypothetical protein
MPLARAAAQSALDLDPASQEAHGVLGMIASVYELGWKRAERQCKMAMTREPVPSYAYAGTAPSICYSWASSGNRRTSASADSYDPLSFIGRFTMPPWLPGNEAVGEAELRELSALRGRNNFRSCPTSLSESLSRIPQSTDSQGPIRRDILSPKGWGGGMACA